MSNNTPCSTKHQTSRSKICLIFLHDNNVKICGVYRAAERIREAWGKIISGAPMTSLFSNKGNHYDRTLLNFRLIIKLGGPSRLGARGKLSPPAPTLSAATRIYVDALNSSYGQYF